MRLKKKKKNTQKKKKQLTRPAPAASTAGPCLVTMLLHQPGPQSIEIAQLT